MLLCRVAERRPGGRLKEQGRDPARITADIVYSSSEPCNKTKTTIHGIEIFQGAENSYLAQPTKWLIGLVIREDRCVVWLTLGLKR